MSRSGITYPDAPSSPVREIRRPLPGRARARPPVILVVGARVADRRQLATLLRHAGYDTREETDGAGALETARESPPDLVIVGILATGMDAEAFTVRMRAEGRLRLVPVLLHSSTRRGTDAKRVMNGAGIIPTAAMRSDPPALLAIVDRLFGRAASAILAVPAVAPGERTATTVGLPTLPVAAFLGSLRSFHAEITRLLEEGVRAAARREGHRALHESMLRTEGMLAGVRGRLTSALALGTAIAGNGGRNALDGYLSGASRDLRDSRAALLAHFGGPSMRPVPLLTLLPGPSPRLPVSDRRGRTPEAGPPLLVPATTVIALPALAGAIRDLDSSTPGTITLGPIDFAAVELLLATTDARVLDVAPAALRVRPRDGEEEFDEPITFDPADITAFHRIVEAGGTDGGPAVPSAGAVAAFPPRRS